MFISEEPTNHHFHRLLPLPLLLLQSPRRKLSVTYAIVSMAATITYLSLLLLLLCFFLFNPSLSLQSKPQSPYLSPSTIFPNYQKMLPNFKIFIYKQPPQTTPPSSSSASHSLFYSSLLTSPFLTQNPNQAHLFLLPFPSDHSTRSIARLIRDLRTDFPYWNRTLGADHFYLSCPGIGYESDRNLVELKKNSVQISCFPTPYGNFIPHKDIPLPPLTRISSSSSRSPAVIASSNNTTARFLGYFRSNVRLESTLVNELKGDPDFLIESQPSDQRKYVENLSTSRFCLFVYGDGGGGDVSGIGEALSFGCVPVVITDRPIQDLPLMDVVMWSEIAVFVGSGGGVKMLKTVLRREDGRYERMREFGVTASKHFVWNESPQPYDAFHMVMYQLWLRRHTIRYARWEAS